MPKKSVQQLLTSLTQIAIILLFPTLLLADQFSKSKKVIDQNLNLFGNKTLYCACEIKGKSIDLESCGYKIQSNKNRAIKREAEHVVPAEAFGNAFSEWRNPNQYCQGKTGRACAKSNPKFNAMEGDIYNLYPEIGELNGLRSNYSMAQLTSSSRDFGGCGVKLSDRKFEPEDLAKGSVARTYMHMDTRYPGFGIISDKNQKLFAAWDKLYPVTKMECVRWKALSAYAGYRHSLYDSRCR